MPDVATSLHLHNVHELLLLVPVRRGFVEQDERRISYGSRLGRALNLLFRPSQSTAEKTLMPTRNFSERLTNIYHFNYGVVERFQQSELILSATFDSSWESYFRNLVDNVGPFLDAVFFHCEGYAGRSCADGYEAFASFIREHQVQTGMLYSATPDLTTDDLRLLRGVARGQELKEPLPTVDEQVEQRRSEWIGRYRSDAWQGEIEYTRLRALGLSQFFLSLWETRKLFTAEESFDSRTAQNVFDNATGLLASAAVDDIEPGNGQVQSVSIDGKTYAFDALTQLLRLAPGDSERKAWLQHVLQIARNGGKSPRNVRKCASTVSNFSNVQDGIVARRDSNAALVSLLRLPIHRPAELMARLRAGISVITAGFTVNVGFTYPGLRRLGLSDETLELLPKEFQEGMELRAGMLGDVGWPNHPDYWRPMGRDGWFSMSSIDLVVVFHFEDGKSNPQIVADAKVLLRQWVGEEHDSCLVHSEYIDIPEADPFSLQLKVASERNQPTIDWNERTSNGSPKQPFDNTIAPGELILGYQDSQGDVAHVACADETCAGVASELFKDGTFLVVRKLAQNGDEYGRFKTHQPREGAEAAALGKPLNPNQSYDKQPDSEYPRTSHRRRSNPRKRDVPRLVRRSYAYGLPSDDSTTTTEVERGHLFMCFNASLAQQYELIQHWINGGNITGVLSNRRDVVAGQHAPHGPSSGKDAPLGVPHVTLRWGLYLFVPSKSALDRFAEIAARSQSRFVQELNAAEARRERQRGVRLIKQLDSISDPVLAQLSWKQLFEEPGAARDARAVWAVVREREEGKETPYGLLLGHREGAKEVLENKGDKYSVREYRQRFLETAGDFYLGLDDEPVRRTCPMAPGLPSYRRLAEANETANLVLSSAAARTTATRATLKYLKTQSSRFEVKELVKHVIGQISADFIGLPALIAKDPAKRSEFLENFVSITRYSSFPYPEAWVKERAAVAGDTLRLKYSDSISTWSGAFKDRLGPSYGTARAIRDAIIIANVGFVPPAISMLTGMLSKWLANGDIQQPRLRDPDSARAVILQELKTDATFTTIYRTKLESDGRASPGKFVVVGVQSAYLDDERKGSKDGQRWMFGGTYAAPSSNSRGAHACPMQDQALNIAIGVVTAVANHVHDRAMETPTRLALVRMTPVTYQFQPVGPVLPLAYSNKLSSSKQGRKSKPVPPRGGHVGRDAPSGQFDHAMNKKPRKGSRA